MSINCSNYCLYQIDGSCNLKVNRKKKSINTEIKGLDCPHFLGLEK